MMKIQRITPTRYVLGDVKIDVKGPRIIFDLNTFRYQVAGQPVRTTDWGFLEYEAGSWAVDAWGGLLPLRNLVRVDAICEGKVVSLEKIVALVERDQKQRHDRKHHVRKG